MVAPPEANPRAPVLRQLDSPDHSPPRGLNVANEGLVFQPLFLLFRDLYSSGSSYLKDVSLTTGVWSSIHSHQPGAEPGHWHEFGKNQSGLHESTGLTIPRLRRAPAFPRLPEINDLNNRPHRKTILRGLEGRGPTIQPFAGAP